MTNADIIYYNFVEDKKGFVKPVLLPQNRYPDETPAEKLFWKRATILFDACQNEESKFYAEQEDMRNLWQLKLTDLMRKEFECHKTIKY